VEVTLIRSKGRAKLGSLGKIPHSGREMEYDFYYAGYLGCRNFICGVDYFHYLLGISSRDSGLRFQVLRLASQGENALVLAVDSV
jgi:hypothetical protein